MSTLPTSMPKGSIASTPSVKDSIKYTTRTIEAKTAKKTRLISKARGRYFNGFLHQITNTVLTTTASVLTFPTTTAAKIPVTPTNPVVANLSAWSVSKSTEVTSYFRSQDETLFERLAQDILPSDTPEPTDGISPGPRWAFFLMVLLSAIGSVIIFALVSWRIDGLLNGRWRHSRFRMLFDEYTEEDESGSELSMTVSASTRSGDNDDDFTTDDILLATAIEGGDFPPSLRNVRHARRTRLLSRKLSEQMVGDDTGEDVEIDKDGDGKDNNSNSNNTNERQGKFCVDHELDGNCPICLEPLKDSPLTKADCGHVMHLSCLSKWLVRDRGLTCPICRMRMRVPNVESDNPGAEASTSTAAGTTNSAEHGEAEIEEDVEGPSLISSNRNNGYSTGTEMNGTESYGWDEEDEAQQDAQQSNDGICANSGTDNRIQQNVLRVDINPNNALGD